MSGEYEDCRGSLAKLIEWYTTRKAQRNEATTRLQLIDRLFFECLGWSKDDVILEEPYGQEFADYTFSSPRRILIVEAKREGQYFELPVGKERIEYSIQSLMRDNASLKAALEQVTGYCQSRGVPFGVVCNGDQIVALIAARSDGLPPLDGKALVFPSLDFALSHFQELWNALSKPGIEKKYLYFTLIGDVRRELPQKLSSTISRYPGTKSRNIFQTNLQILSELVIEDIARSSDLETLFLKECYCLSGALSQHSLISKYILQTRYAALFDSSAPGPLTIPLTDKKGISPELIAESLSRRPILLIGDRGVGKTTFVNHLIRIDAPEVFQDAVTLYIDFGSQAALALNLREFVPQEIIRQLRDSYQVDVEERNFVRGVYNLEIERFNKGIYSDLKETTPALFREKEVNFIEQKISNITEHLKECLQHISKGRRKQIVVFLDNADQRSDKDQEEVFLMSQELAQHWPATIFVALRPETFHRSRQVGALSGYHPKAFTISPPRVDLVIEKRLQFALKLTSGEIPIQSTGQGIKIQLSSLDIIIRVMLDSLRRNSDLAESIDNISSGNVRLALDLIKGFFGSGHVDTEKIVKIYEDQGNYFIPLHEFLRAVIFGDAEYFDPDPSPIVNLFDVYYHDSKEHFLLPVLLGMLNATMASRINEGFLDTNIAYEQLQGLGFAPEQIDFAINRGCKKNIIETIARKLPDPIHGMPPALRVTSVGLYHLNRLCSNFVYIDAILIDVPIFESLCNLQLRDVQDIHSRLDRADSFRKYLDEKWEPLKNIWTGFNWSAASVDLAKHIEFVRTRV
ncbi:MAG: hypothetical protein ABSF90_14335 [Syntrophobacteraceae bacterium]